MLDLMVVHTRKSAVCSIAYDIATPPFIRGVTYNSPVNLFFFFFSLFSYNALPLPRWESESALPFASWEDVLDVFLRGLWMAIVPFFSFVVLILT